MLSARARAVVLTSLLVACSHAPAPPAPVVADLGWLVGRWERPDGVEHWVDANGVLWGVGFTVKADRTAFFEVLLIERDGQGVRYVALPGGKTEVAFPLVDAGANTATFANPQHDFPKTIRYQRTAEQLAARVAGDGPAEEFRWRRAAPGRAEALEAADRAFAAATTEHGLAGWMAAFDPTGWMWSRQQRARLDGPAIRASMASLFEKGTKIEWAPIASGLSPAGDLGYTVGTARFSTPGPDGAVVETHRGSYVTIWRRDGAGWKVWFDTGT